MLQPVLEIIKENLLTQNPSTFQQGYAGARQYQDGKIVIYDNSEGEYVGLKDNASNYFYIRYLGEMEVDIADGERRSTSCDELTATSPLRLVAWVKNADIAKLIDVLLHDIMSSDFNSMTNANKEAILDPALFFTAILTDPEQIYKDETGSEDVSLEKGVTLVAIDFGVRFNYKLRNADCIDRNLCSSTC